MLDFIENDFYLKSGSIHYKLRFISEPIFVFIYGGMGEIDLSTWDNLIHILPSDLSILAFDRPGIGQSEKSTLPRNAENITAEIKALLDYLKFSNYILVGHSIGGLYARYFSCRYPDNIVGLILLDSTHEDQLLLGSNFYDPKALKESIKHSQQNPEGLIIPDDPNKSFDQMRQYKTLPKNIKTIIVAAENSLPEQITNADKLNHLNLTIQRELSFTSSNAKFQLFKNCSHFIYIDQPEKTAELITSIL